MTSGARPDTPHARTRQRGSFTLPLPPAEAFDLFTAEGERRWVAGWEPVILSDCGATKPGAVFLTDHGGEPTIWTLLEYDREAGRLAYSRVSPGRRAGTVRVSLGPDGEGTRVKVAYDITSLGSEGDAAVRSMDAAGFDRMLHEWRRLIRVALESSHTRAQPA
ncbi:MAG TPA: SRPBCC family protein [Sphingomicrobium sp.]|nr:SRPBCC family protein [Sphingomicrobium sp.]